MHVIHSKLPRDGGSSRYIALNKYYTCPSLSSTVPQSGLSSCQIPEENYKINIEHGDIFTVTYASTSGGYRKLFDIVNNRYYKTNTYVGKDSEKAVELRFDFIAPVHCSEQAATAKCNSNEQPIGLEADITKNPIKAQWSGWSDGLSGIAYYLLEIFELKPNIHGDLTEFGNPNWGTLFLLGRFNQWSFFTFLFQKIGKGILFSISRVWNWAK
ncbi:uncharacterized protein LOC132756885 [Ruditapes philippinarum]|uniref:uncharacterized protein LOC132756885 n=1 Tax=Ruditapes philippinarum TaxID=129788 RepID=UPI00295BAE6B|nr:uncharacterized protein LOC132756885 [Ruditapes philippinarum]